MASISTLRVEIAENLATIAGLRVNADGKIPENVNPPYAIVTPTSVDYHKAFNNALNTYNFTITVVVGRADARSAQNTLDAYCSPTGTSSIKLAIESDKSLGGKAFDTRVSEMRNYGQVTIGEVIYLSAEFTVLCYAD